MPLSADCQETVLLPLLPFPPLSWWAVAASEAFGGIFEQELYQKQTLRNRFELIDAQGRFTLTLPIDHVHRRQHRGCPMADLHFSRHVGPNQLLRSVRTAYGGAPFFEHVMPELQALFRNHGPGSQEGTLGEFAKASMRMMADWSDAQWMFQATNESRSPMNFGPSDAGSWVWPRYGQPFEDRNGFLGGCSGLDALFCAGNQWDQYLPTRSSGR